MLNNEMHQYLEDLGDFPGGSVVTTLPSSAVGWISGVGSSVGWIPGWRAKIPYAW